jgi:hypothetical protein
MKYVLYQDHLNLDLKMRELWRINNEKTNNQYWFVLNEDDVAVSLVHAPLDWRPAN